MKICSKKKSPKWFHQRPFDWISLSGVWVRHRWIAALFPLFDYSFFVYLLLQRSIPCKEFIISIYSNTIADSCLFRLWCIRISVLPTSRNAWIYIEQNKKIAYTFMKSKCPPALLIQWHWVMAQFQCFIGLPISKYPSRVIQITLLFLPCKM